MMRLGYRWFVVGIALAASTASRPVYSQTPSGRAPSRPADDSAASMLETWSRAGTLSGLRWPRFPYYRDELTSLYAATGWRPIWTASSRPTADARVVIELLRGAEERGLRSEDYDAPELGRRFDVLSADPRPAAHDVAWFDLALSVGTVAMVTLTAFADRAVGTALPSIVRDLDALASFGLANAGPAASFLVTLAFAGAWADRRGPLPVLRTGVVAFGLAQLLVGLAAAIAVVIVGRLLSGIGEALVDVSLIVLVAKAIPSELRPRIFSLVSAAWVRFPSGTEFDFAFVDADKPNYINYYEKLLQLVRPGGLICADNTLGLSGAPIIRQNSVHAKAMDEFNRHVHHDERVDLSMVSIGEGLSLLRRR